MTVLWLVVAAAWAGRLALLKLGPNERELLVGIEVYRELDAGLLVDADRIPAGLAGRAVTLDEELAAGEYFLVYRVGPAADTWPGRLLWQDERHSLVRLAEPAARAAKGSGLVLVQLPARPYPLPARDQGRIDIPEPDTAIARLMQEVSLDSLRQGIRRLESFRTRYSYNAPKCESAGVWLYQRFLALGLETKIDTYYLRQPTTRSFNVEATLAGTVRPESVVIACGHYDSYSTQPNSLAPGADDNASGTAAVLELARVFANARFRSTVKFLAFSGEEQWMKGSYHWVDSVAVPEGMKIAGVYNLDMLAYTAADTTRAVVNTNAASRGLAVLAESVNVRYGLGLRLINYLDEDCAGDNTPFWERGYRAVFACEDSEYGIWRGSNPHYHKTSDTLGNLRMGQELRATRLAAGCLATIAGFQYFVGVGEGEMPHAARGTPGPTIVRSALFVPAYSVGRRASGVLVDVAGRKVMALRPGTNDASGLAPGVYFACGPSAVHRVVKVR